MNTTKAVFPRHFYSLDALRGLAALSVVLWHWQNFFYGGPFPVAFQRERQPFYEAFEFLYTAGWRAVDLFFCLSGFIFFWLYADKIDRRVVSLRKFAALRFSRLYPLHFATLLFVAAAQMAFLRTFGQSFVYQGNDGRHFILQLFLASSWGLEKRITFNGPVWSVSVEVLLYGVFFLLCTQGWRRWWQLSLLVLAGIFGFKFVNAALGRGFLSFFVGGLTFQLCHHLAQHQLSRRTLWLLAIVTAVSWLCLPVLVYPDTVAESYKLSRWHLNWPIHGTDVLTVMLKNAVQFLPELVVYPLTILTLALWEMNRRLPVRGFAFLGQISYSSYLLHFPLQMVFIGITRRLSIPTSFYYSPGSLVGFYAVLLPLSMACFRCFELPCQSWLRARLLPATGGIGGTEQTAQ